MVALPKLNPGLDLYRSSDEAVYAAMIVFLVTLIPMCALLLTLPASGNPEGTGPRFDRLDNGEEHLGIGGR